MGRRANVLIAGGSGFWSNNTHCAAMVALRMKGVEARLVGVCDPIDPHSARDRPNLRALVNEDSPQWIDPATMDSGELEDRLDRLHYEEHIDVLITATNPVHHYFYTKWAVKNRINAICDKPLVAVPDASFDLHSAKQIWRAYLDVRKEILKARRENEAFSIICPLRRRAMAPFMQIASGLSEVHLKTGEGISHANVIQSCGIHKFPAELTNGGAHGYLDGIGSLSHSSYHYLDAMAWYLSAAPGETEEIEVSMPYLSRIRDYLDSGDHARLMRLVEGGMVPDWDVDLPERVLNAERDMTFHLKLLDGDGRQRGLMNYTCNYTTFTPRTQRFDGNIVEYANERNGGRMSHLYIDVHQGALQNFQLVKNDVVFRGHSILLNRRIHPRLGQDSLNQRFDDAYEKNAITVKEMVAAFIQKSAGMDHERAHLGMAQPYEGQALTNRLYSKFYELMAAQASGKEDEVDRRIRLGDIV
ncbi:MAG: Gfo/Idh/MocA family oxidoreductase [Candidatus Micrarchaeota archaeon]|nr:Gfo/Idh/MocA family oxidoreductase [Candidatus Micrarchaeota archaeon]